MRNEKMVQAVFRPVAVSALILLSVLSGLIGCTKKSESSSVALNSDWTALTKHHAKARGSQQSAGIGTLSRTPVITRIMINVSAPDIQNPIVRIWDLDSVGYLQGSGNAPPLPPSEFVLDVPRGSNRLIQVLAIIEEMDSSSGGDGPMTFYYDDESVTVGAEVARPVIGLVAQSVASNGDGSVSGRYFNSDGSTPTGAVNMYYAPSGQPPMIVEKSHIFSGYFHFYLLPGVPFTFRLANGATILEKVSPESLAALHSARVATIKVPEGYRDRGSARAEQQPKTKVYGFFGPGAGLISRQVCFPNLGASIPQLFSSSNLGDTSLVPWDSASSSSSYARIVGGGVGTSTGSCSTGNFGVEQFGLLLNYLADGDSPLGTNGPFARYFLDGNNDDLHGTLVGSNLTLNWRYLNGVAGNSVDGVAIFTKNLLATESPDKWHDFAPCNELVSSHGFTEIARVPIGSVLAPVESHTITGVPAASYQSGRFQTLVCPFKNGNGRLYDFALNHYNHSGGGPQPATKIALRAVGNETATSSSDRQPFAPDTCTPVRIQTINDARQPAERVGGIGPTTFTVTVDGAPAGVKLYSDLNCSDPSVGASTIAYETYSTERWFSVKAANGSGDFRLDVTDSTSGGNALSSGDFYGGAIGADTATAVKTYSASNVVTFQCYPIYYFRQRPLGTLLIGESGTAGNITHASPAGVTYYGDPDCSVSTGSYAPITSGGSWTKSYFMFSAASGATTMTPNTGAISISADSHSITTVAVDSPVKVRVDMLPQNPIDATDCVPVRLLSYDSQGRRSPTPTTITFAPTFAGVPSTTGYGFHTDPACTAAISSPNLGAGNFKQNLYLRWSTPGATVTIDLNPSMLDSADQTFMTNP